jgi:DNA mismatch repair protein MutH
MVGDVVHGEAGVPPAPDREPQTGALLVTVGVLALYGFAVVAGAVGLPVSERVLTALDMALTLVVGFWLGSSAGSRAKDAVVAAMSGLRR